MQLVWQPVWRGCALLLALAACGDDGGKSRDAAGPDAAVPDPNEGLRSGTRLHLQWHTYGETRAFAGLFDSQRNESCNATRWADGNTYCTPAAANVVYTDASCTQPIAQVAHVAGCTDVAPTYLLASAVTGCNSQPAHLYMAGAKITAVPYYQQDRTTGMCTGPNTPSANFFYYGSGAEVAATDLAGLTRAASDDAGRIKRQFLTSADGAKIFDLPHDSMLDLDCAPTVTSDATAGTCAPIDAVAANYFHDNACTQGELNTTAECPKPAYASQAVHPECTSSALHYFAVGDPATAPPLYLAVGCSSTTAPGDSAFYLLGQPLATSSLTRAADTTAGRTVQLIHYSDGTSQVRDSVLYDTQHLTECNETTAADGSVRCLPVRGNLVTLFSDPGCTQAVDLARVDVMPATCTALPVPKFVFKNLPPVPGTCGNGLSIYDVGAPYTGPLYQGGSCTAVDTTATQYYALGTAHTVDEFPLATPAQDP
jgi:hypothetical protein